MITRSSTAVEFHSGRSRIAPLTWGQEFIWDLMRDWELVRSFAVITKWLPIPLLLSVGEMLDQLGELMRRHEALRTLYHPTVHGGATQEVLASGSLTIEVVDRPADDPVDYNTIVTDCLVRAAETRFDHDKELPIRFSLILQDGIPVLVTFVVSHLAADFTSADLLVADLTALLRARADGEPAPAARPASQPADLAAFENLPEGQLRNVEAMRFIRTQLDRSLPDLLPARATPATPRFFRGALESDAIPVAVALASRRYRTSTSVLLLAITTALVRCFCPGPVYPLDIMQSNRVTPDLFGTVSSLSQAILTMVDLTAGSFAELVQGCSATMAAARRHARHRRRSAQQVLGAAGVGPGCQFNDTWSTLPGRSTGPLATRDDLERLAESTTFSWPEKVHFKDKILFIGVRGSAERIHLSLFADTALLPPDDIRGFLYAFERVAMTLAAEDVSLVQISRLFDEYRQVRPASHGR